MEFATFVCFRSSVSQTANQVLHKVGWAGFTVGCFIFSPFSIFKNPGVSVGGVLGKNSTPKILAHCDVIKMWLKTVEVSEAQNSKILSYLKNRLS